jgi:Uri superfamily endonuclease
MANAALIVAGLLDNYYTCLETVFLRISHFFENELSSDHWHSDLLEKMTIRIEGVRIPAVSESNQGNLIELLKFRHFRRYYF